MRNTFAPLSLSAVKPEATGLSHAAIEHYEAARKNGQYQHKWVPSRRRSEAAEILCDGCFAGTW